mgnify:FL=1
MLRTLERVLQSVWGESLVQREPADSASYSPGKRPDLALHTLGRRAAVLLGDLKLYDPVGSDPTKTGGLGATVAFGNTLFRALELSLGHEERGRPSEGRWDPLSGAGHLPAAKGEYAGAIAQGADVQVLLVETFGGMAPQLLDLLARAAAEVENRLNKAQYDDTTWAARTWMSYATHQLSVSLHRSVAWEAANAMGVPGVGAAADIRGGISATA